MRPASVVFACEPGDLLPHRDSAPDGEMCASEARPRPVALFQAPPKRSPFLAGPRKENLRRPLQPGTGPTSLPRLTVYPGWDGNQYKRGEKGGDIDV